MQSKKVLFKGKSVVFTANISSLGTTLSGGSGGGSGGVGSWISGKGPILFVAPDSSSY